jgi:hypothetical protein
MRNTCGLFKGALRDDIACTSYGVISPRLMKDIIKIRIMAFGVVLVANVVVPVVEVGVAPVGEEESGEPEVVCFDGVEVCGVPVVPDGVATVSQLQPDLVGS